MKKRFRTVILCLCAVLAVSLFGCNKPDDNPPGPDPAGPTIPVAENFDFSAALADSEGWNGITSVNPVLDSENRFMTFREKSNAAVAYEKKGMSTGLIELKLKVKISTDTTAYIAFSNQAEDLSAFCYAPGGRTYTVELSSDGKMYVKKWIDEVETKLTGSKPQASIPLSLSTQFTALQITVAETKTEVSVKVSVGGSLVLDVTDSTDPILGGGAVGVSYMGTGGMALGAKDSVDADYQEPEALGLNLYEQPNTALADSDVDLLADFSNTWTGRERIFTTSRDGNSVTFESKDNPEEPQAGVTEYQGIYQDKIFGDVQYEYDFNVVSHGEWIMFWFRCVPEKDTDVSIWGNKKTRQNTNGYSMLVTAGGYVQVHKWADGAQIWLNGQGTKLPGTVAAKFSDPKASISLKMSIAQVTVAGEPVIEFRIQVDESNKIIVQDTDTPFLNAGYTGVQGYAIGNGTSAVKFNSAVAKKQITL